jgi:hypothetical protein
MIASLARTTALRVTRPTARTLTTSARRSADPAATPTAAGSGKKLDSKEPVSRARLLDPYGLG